MAALKEPRTPRDSLTAAETFEHFYRRNYPGVVTLVYAVSGDRNGVEDICQEAFARAHRQWDTIAAHHNPAGGGGTSHHGATTTRDPLKPGLADPGIPGRWMRCVSAVPN